MAAAGGICAPLGTFSSYLIFSFVLQCPPLILSLCPSNRSGGGGGGDISFGVDPVGVCIASCLQSISWTNGWILTKLAQTHYWDGGKKWFDFGDLDLIFKVTPTLNVKFVGVHVRVDSCLQSIFWTNGWILTKLTQTHYWDGGKKWLDFGDLDLIFKVTPALWNFDHKKLVCTLMTDSGQIVTGWVKDLIRFWWPWPNFQGHHTIKTVKMSLVWALSPEPNGGFWPNYTETPLEHGKEMMSNFDPKKLVCTQ